MNFIDKVITFVIAVTLIPTILSSVGGLTADAVLDVDGVTVLTQAGALNGTAAGTLLDLAPLLFIAAIIVWFYAKSKRNA